MFYSVSCDLSPLSLSLSQDAMDVLGMEKDEQMALLRTVAGILHFGNIEVKQSRSDQVASIPIATG